MARIHSDFAPETASPEVLEIYEKTLRGKPGNAQKALAHRPEMLKNFLPFYASVGRSLDRKLYEMIYHSRVSHQRLPLLHPAPRRCVKASWLDWGRLVGAQGGGLSRVTPKEHAALTYVDKLTRTPHDISDANFAH